MLSMKGMHHRADRYISKEIKDLEYRWDTLGKDILMAPVKILAKMGLNQLNFIDILKI